MAEDRKSWHAVRCCCNPAQVLGFIRLSEANPETTVIDNKGGQHRIKLAPLLDQRRAANEVAHANAREIAVHSEHRPIEFWRTIKGFMEAEEPVR